MENFIRENIQQVQEEIVQAAEKSGRKPEEIKLVAVSKTYPPQIIKEAHHYGLNVFGENRVQEAENKIQTLSHLDLEWHLIGPLQSNKVKKALPLFSMIHSVDRVKLINALEKEAAKSDSIIDILIQVNLGGEESKSGVDPDALEALLSSLQTNRHLRCHGLMAIPPYLKNPEDVRPHFSLLRELAEHFSKTGVFTGPRLELSMGMSHDFSVAIEEGATMVRVGSAIFGPRNYG